MLALVTPVAICTSWARNRLPACKRIDATEDKKSVEQRARPEGELESLARRKAPAPGPAARRGCRCHRPKAKSGDEVYNPEACVACRRTGAGWRAKGGFDKGRLGTARGTAVWLRRHFTTTPSRASMDSALGGWRLRAVGRRGPSRRSAVVAIGHSGGCTVHW